MLVIAPDGVQVGVLELKKAIIVAEELGLDLVEVSPESKPPVARLMDYGKYKYELSQKAKESRKNQVKISVSVPLGDFKFSTALHSACYDIKKLNPHCCHLKKVFSLVLKF